MTNKNYVKNAVFLLHILNIHSNDTEKVEKKGTYKLWKQK